ncbi:hydrogenase nickel incorporation protein HypB [Rhodoferax antarcticus]|uniref:hydrogenase nickel incorporation protein HypB n=1 Tax=Rhodoferax antarcticus TaxID=81479 RepID=UPI00222585C5|nr:hydrogenase nickel incorporation protein HypB [Rhodoferax antarcticus]MCW2314128.1 hydrogenase nickel incorporation protein HypB [Rhodoferax antarcticus]
MCVVCGCSATGAIEGSAPVLTPQTGDLHFGAGTARVSVPGMTQERAIKLEADVLGANKLVANQNRTHFASHGVTAYNLVSSPGSGKTTLLCATIEALKQRAPQIRLAVIEGDQQTSHDADRIRATGVPAIQVNTGKGCHLDAPMVAAAFARLDLHAHSHGHPHAHPHTHTHTHGEPHDPHHPHDDLHAHPHDHDHTHPHDHAHPAPEALLFIENVGNLVCPAMWDLGERAKVAILSVTEGEDKPLKYPDMFAAAKLMVLTKTDLLPHLNFDMARCKAYARRVNPGIEIIELSANTGEGMQTWLDWLLDAPVQDAKSTPPTALQDRIQQLEAELAQLKALQT